MCGRYTLSAKLSALTEVFDVPPPGFEQEPRFNIAPGQQAPVVAADGRGPRMGLMTWGLVPGWMEDPGRGLINARAETVGTKRSFRASYARRRCLIPADGFYEWRASGHGGATQPVWIHPRLGRVVSFAGVWARWSRPGHETVHGFAVLTTDANQDLHGIHDRMPVVIAEGDRPTWLDRSASLQRVQALLRPPPAGTFGSHAVSRRVNDPAEDDPGLITSAQ